MIPARVKKIDVFFNHVSSYLEYSKINPIEDMDARELFFKKKEDPEFDYLPLNDTLSIFQQAVEVIDLGDTPIEKLLKKKQREIILKMKMLQSIGTPSFTKHSLALYPAPDANLVAVAKKLVKLPTSQLGEKILRKDALTLIRDSFKLFEFTWRVYSKDIVTSAIVMAGKKQILLKKSERFYRNYLLRLLVHEIGTHVLRAENGLEQPLHMFKNGTASYLETEEGLAAYNEYRFGFMSNNILKNYAGRVLAIDYSLKYGFKKTYTYLLTYFAPKVAWKLTLRAKRGLKDTSKRGAFTKDAVYLRGFLNVLEYAQKRSVDELYIGKIGISDLSIVKQLPDIKPPRYKIGPLINLVAQQDSDVDQGEVAKIQKILNTYLSKKNNKSEK